MSMMVSLTMEARIDLREYARYIELDNPSAARLFVNAIQRTIQSIGDFPLAAPLHPALKPGARGIRRRVVQDHRAYLVYYRIQDAQHIKLLRILHAARRVPDDWLKGA